MTKYAREVGKYTRALTFENFCQATTTKSLKKTKSLKIKKNRLLPSRSKRLSISTIGMWRGGPTSLCARQKKTEIKKHKKYKIKKIK